MSRIARMADRICELEEQLETRTEERDAARDALSAILEIGKRDLTNPKYDAYFEAAKVALAL